jgi:hypothetical protein
LRKVCTQARRAQKQALKPVHKTGFAKSDTPSPMSGNEGGPPPPPVTQFGMPIGASVLPAAAAAPAEVEVWDEKLDLITQRISTTIARLAKAHGSSPSYCRRRRRRRARELHHHQGSSIAS